MIPVVGGWPPGSSPWQLSTSAAAVSRYAQPGVTVAASPEQRPADLTVTNLPPSAIHYYDILLQYKEDVSPKTWWKCTQCSMMRMIKHMIMLQGKHEKRMQRVIIVNANCRGSGMWHSTYILNCTHLHVQLFTYITSIIYQLIWFYMIIQFHFIIFSVWTHFQQNIQTINIWEGGRKHNETASNVLIKMLLITKGILDMLVAIMLHFATNQNFSNQY